MTQPLWTSAAIAAATGGKSDGTWNATGVSIDTRTIKPGDLFVALQGPNFDANNFDADALSKGAAGVLVSRVTGSAPLNKIILVEDTLKALEKLGAASRARSNATAIAITGSVGKTGCKEALRQVLSPQGTTHASRGSYNNHWGVPLSLSQMPADAKYGVFELGMNHAGELKPLSKLVKPHVALITGIAAVHVGNFSGLDEIARAKAEIFDGLESNGTAVLPGDDAYYPLLKECASQAGVKNIARFGKSDGCEATLLNFTLHAENSLVQASILGKELSYTIGAPGMHWVTNSLAILLCAGLAGADIQRAAKALENLQLARGRGAAKAISIPGGAFTLVDESYNASPASIEAAIRVLAQRAPGKNGRRILVLGDMKELGEQTEKLHYELADPINKAGIDLVFACGDSMRHLMSMLPKSRIGAWEATSLKLAPIVADMVRNGDIVTVKGSHSMMMEKVVAALAALETSAAAKKSAV